MVLFVNFSYCNWLTAFLHFPNLRILLQTLLQTHCLFFPLFVIACLNTFVYTFILRNKIRWVHVSYLYVYFQCWSFGSGQPIDMFIPGEDYFFHSQYFLVACSYFWVPSFYSLFPWQGQMTTFKGLWKWWIQSPVSPRMHWYKVLTWSHIAI